MSRQTAAGAALALIAPLIVLGGGLALWSASQARQIEERFPPIGDFVVVDGLRLHVVDSGEADLPAVLFIHGASANLRDQHAVYAEALDGIARTIFVDRPGHGYSERGDDMMAMAGPEPQSRLFGQLLTELGVDRAVVLGHSYGGAVATTMAVTVPDKVAGLVNIAGPTHTWDTGIAWHHDYAAPPIVGPAFVRTAVMPFARATDAVAKGVDAVFEPQPLPEDYREQTAPDLTLRPLAFRSNSQDMEVLLAHNERFTERYGEISAPTSIIHGDADTTVGVSLHSEKLVEQVDGAELHVLPGVGHKPDYVAEDVVLREIRRVAAAAGMQLGS
ncbi:MAG: alpha/beta hydrolase [Pseudomonadota bacterium]